MTLRRYVIFGGQLAQARRKYGLDPVEADLFTFGKVISGGLPAGGLAKVEPVSRTTSIISPPPRNGGRVSSRS